MDEQTENTLRQIIGEQDDIIRQQKALIANLTETNAELKKMDEMNNLLIEKYKSIETEMRALLQIAGITV